jgi:predicted naringenin-chalcone synthase
MGHSPSAGAALSQQLTMNTVTYRFVMTFLCCIAVRHQLVHTSHVFQEAAALPL